MASRDNASSLGFTKLEGIVSAAVWLSRAGGTGTEGLWGAGPTNASGVPDLGLAERPMRASKIAMAALLG